MSAPVLRRPATGARGAAAPVAGAGPSAASALRMQGVRVTPPGRGAAPVLDGFDLTVAPGETVALVGRSGAGKSVTVRTVLGLHPPGWSVEGTVQVDGSPVDVTDSAAARALRLRRTAVVLQDPRATANPVRTIADFVTEAAIERGQDRATALARAEVLLEEVGLPDPARTLARFPHELSGGMLQRVAIAAALSGEPALLIADEPTAALDVLTQAEVIATLDRARVRHGFGLLLVTHDLALAAAVADRVVVLAGGEIADAVPSERLDAATHPATRSLLDAAAATSLTSGVRRSAPDPDPTGAAADVLEVRDLSRSFGSRVALDGVSLSIPAGRTLALVGGSGSGKSTLARIVTGLERADRGSVILGAGASDVGDPARPRRAPRVQMVFQDPALSLDPRLTAGRAVERALATAGVARRERGERARDLLGLVGLDTATAGRRPHEMSGGQCQRVSIARALALDPDLLVLDEATSALDPPVRAQIIDLLAGLQARLGLTLLVITHDFGVVARLADEVVVLHRGEVAERGPAARVMRAPQAPYTRLLLEALPHRGWRPEELATGRRVLDAGHVGRGGGPERLAGELQGP